jgi:3-hydroxyacyl-CoA dehydrogenase
MTKISTAKRGQIVIITVDNPPVNALSQHVRAGLLAEFSNADNDESIAAIVLVCAGRTFIAGADIREFDKPPQTPQLPELIARIEDCDKPVVAAIHGSALGGGLEVSLSCHYRIAASNARVGLPEVNLGLLPGASGTQRLPRIAGFERALDIMISGKPIPAIEAAEIGIIDKVVNADDLLESALNFAADLIEHGGAVRRIRDLPVETVNQQFFAAYRHKIAKRTRGLMAPERIIRCVEAATTLPFDDALTFEREQFLLCKASSQSTALRYSFFAEREARKVPDLSDHATPRDVNRVAVIGAGTMGAGIAYSCINAGIPVTLIDNNAESLASGQRSIEALYGSAVATNRVSEADMTAGLARLQAVSAIEYAADADLVIEAVFENMSVKREIFAALDDLCRPGTILASNTSTLDIDQIAAATNRPIDVCGMHFFSPAHIMRLVEVVRGERTATDVIVTILALAKRLNKLGVVVGNCFGFVGNRMLYGYGRESQLLLLEGCPPEFIDSALYDWGMAMGPNAVGDLAGLDVGYKVRQERADLPDDPRFYRVSDALVELGRFGQKTKQGIYRYEAGSRSPIPDPAVQALITREAKRLEIEQRDITAEEVIDRCIVALIVEGARILEEGIALRPSDIDVIWTNGYGFPRHRGGPMHYADTVGIDVIANKVRTFRKNFGPMYWEMPALLEDLAATGGRFADL